MSPELQYANLPLPVTRQIDALCDEFEAALKLGDGAALEQYLQRVDRRGHELLLRELAVLALEQLREKGAADPLADLTKANPALREELIALIPYRESAPTIRLSGDSSRSGKASGLVIRCPHCHDTIEMIADAPLVDIGCANCGGRFGLVNDADATRDAATLTKVAHFELIDRLGMGEFGTVWKARDTILDRTVALKIPRREQLDAASIEKFMREARAAAQLRHPNIVSTHEVGRHADTLYIVSDYIRGVSLADMIADHRLDIRESVGIAAKVADALEHAHRRGVIHRDLKPSNILIDDNGEPHLMDFGLAKRQETEVTITTDGAILGTPAYMPPEQARGEASQVDGRSDVYSLGVILFQMLSGELPFRGSMQVLLQKVINDDPPGPRSLDAHVSKDLDTICLKCLEKDPNRRYSTAAELAADLRRYLAGEPIAARRIGAPGRALRWARRNRAVSLLLAAIAFTLMAATISSSYFAWRAAQNATRADQQSIALQEALYDSLLQEIRLTREVRRQGYGEKVRQLVERALDHAQASVDKHQLRRELSLTMGDFVAYRPKIITPPIGQITTLRLSPDGQEVLVGQNNGRITVYDTNTLKPRAQLQASAAEIRAVAFSPRSDRLISADKVGTVYVWKRAGETWDVERTFTCGDAPSSVFLSRHGELAASVRGHLLDVWDVATGIKLRSLPTEPDWSIRNAAFDLSNRRLAAGILNAPADTVGWALWDIDTGERLNLLDMPTLGGTYADGIDFAGAANRLAIGFDEALLVYELTDFERTRVSGFDSTKAVAFSPNKPYLAALNIRGSITLWNWATNRQVATLHHPATKTSRNSLSFSDDGRRLAASNAESIQIWDLSGGDEKTILAGHKGAIPCAAFDANGQLLATGGKDNEVRFWDLATGQLADSLQLDEALQTLAFSSDGRLLAAGCMGRDNAPHLRLIDVESTDVIHEEAPAMGEVYSLAWVEVPKGRYLAGSGDQGVALWKVHSGPPVRLEQVFDAEAVWCLATVINRDAGLIVWAEGERRLKAWDLVARKELPLHAPDMLQGWHGLTILPDDRSILYIANDGVATVWDVRNNRRAQSIGKPGTFTAPHIALSPDGKWLAALTQPDAVSIWHRPTGQHVYSMRPETGTVWALAWDPSSQHLAVGQSDGSLAVWHLPRIQEELAEFGLQWRAGD